MPPEGSDDKPRRSKPHHQGSQRIEDRPTGRVGCLLKPLPTAPRMIARVQNNKKKKNQTV